MLTHVVELVLELKIYANLIGHLNGRFSRNGTTYIRSSHQTNGTCSMLWFVYEIRRFIPWDEYIYELNFGKVGSRLVHEEEM